VHIAGDSVRVVHTQTTVAEDITAIADHSLEDRLALVYLKSGGRALIKLLAAEAAKAKLKERTNSDLVNFLSSLAIDAAIGATERADVRSWRTLPAQIQFARMELAPGSYRVTVSATDHAFRIAAETVTVRPGKVTFFIVDDIR